MPGSWSAGSARRRRWLQARRGPAARCQMPRVLPRKAGHLPAVSECLCPARKRLCTPSRTASLPHSNSLLPACSAPGAASAASCSACAMPTCAGGWTRVLQYPSLADVGARPPDAGSQDGGWRKVLDWPWQQLGCSEGEAPPEALCKMEGCCGANIPGRHTGAGEGPALRAEDDYTAALALLVLQGWEVSRASPPFCAAAAAGLRECACRASCSSLRAACLAAQQILHSHQLRSCLQAPCKVRHALVSCPLGSGAAPGQVCCA